MRRAFKYLDRDKSQTLDAAELKKCVRGLGKNVTDQDVANFIRKADTTGDNRLGFEEFYDVMLAQIGSGHGSGHGLDMKNLPELFRTFDSDSSGQISHNEFEYMLQHNLRIDLSNRETRVLINMLDRDNNGEISFVELSAMVQIANDPASGTLSSGC